MSSSGSGTHIGLSRTATARMNLSILDGYRQLPQATGLNYSIINDDGSKAKALGWEIEENSAMDGTLGAGAGYTVLSGNFNQFAIVDRVGTKIELVPAHLRRQPQANRRSRVLSPWRVGSGVLVHDALRLTNHST